MKLTINNLNDVYRAKMATPETLELKGYTWITNLFADSSGVGLESEASYTQSQLITELTKLVKKYGIVYAYITNAGYFQVNIGIYLKTGKKIAKKIDNNTLLIEYPDYKAIRLHDTNILVFKNNTITLNSGGYQTRTTKDRLNKYLPQNFNVYQKNYTWYISDALDKTTTEFKDGITVTN